MPRAASPFYNQQAAPWGEIGHSLGRALFGDPDMAAKQAQAQAQADAAAAQAEADRAHARVYNSQADGIGGQNAAAIGLPDLIARLAPQARPAPPETLDGFLSPDYQPPGPQQTPDEAFRQNLPAVIAAMGQMQGEHIDPTKSVGALSAFMGGDELARRGLVAQGHTPTDDFAITPQRADEIAAAKAAAGMRQAFGVANINNASDIPIANIQGNTSRAVAEIGNRDDIRVAEIAAGSRENVATIKERGTPVSDGRSVASSVYPGARITQVERDPNSALGRANPNSWHNRSSGAVDVAPIAGMTFEQYIQGYRDKGYKIIEALNEVGTGRSAHATGDHWHVVLGEPGTGKAGKAPKAINDKQVVELNTRLKTALRDKGLDVPQIIDTPAVLNMLRQRVIVAYQQSGNPVGAVEAAIKSIRLVPKDKAPAQGAVAAAEAPPMAGAEKAPDGKWYVRKNGRVFEVIH